MVVLGGCTRNAIPCRKHVNASRWASDKGKPSYCEPVRPIRPCVIWPLPRPPASSHPTGLLAFCAPDTSALFPLTSPCSLYLKHSLSPSTDAAPLILQSSFWPGFLPLEKPHRLDQNHLSQVSITPSSTSPLSPGGTCDSCSHRALSLEEPNAWFNALLSPS